MCPKRLFQLWQGWCQVWTVGQATVCYSCDVGRMAGLNGHEAPGKVVTARPPIRLAQLSSVSHRLPSFQLCESTGQKRQNRYDLAAYTSETIGSDHVRWFVLEIDRYGFSEADTDISAIHGPMYRPMPIFPNFLNLFFCFIIKNMVYFMPYLFFKNFKNQDLWAKIFEIAAISIFDQVVSTVYTVCNE